MAANPLPRTIDLLMALAEDAADGAAAHQTAIGLLQNTEARIRADLTALEAAEQNFQTARQTGLTLTTAQRVADSNARAFIGMAKNVLEPVLGSQWSTAWAPTGFVTSLTIPTQIAERQTMLASLRDYFTAHPAHEIAPLNITAARATTLHTALSDARSAANAGLVDRGQKRAARNAARKALEKRVGGLIAELDQLLEGSDPIWLAFGLNTPDGQVTPEAPSNVVLTLGGPGEVLADWDDVANADHYRVFKQEVTVDADFVVAGSPSDSDLLMAGVASGHTLRVKVRAVSGALEGPFSDVAEIVLGAPGPGPSPPTLSGQWVAPPGLAFLSWTSFNDPNLIGFSVRATVGQPWDDTNNSEVAMLTPTQTSLQTQHALFTPGSIATFRVFALLSNGDESGSNPVTIQRP